jgi:hypothetical protein
MLLLRHARLVDRFRNAGTLKSARSFVCALVERTGAVPRTATVRRSHPPQSKLRSGANGSRTTGIRQCPPIGPADLGQSARSSSSRRISLLCAERRPGELDISTVRLAAGRSQDVTSNLLPETSGERYERAASGSVQWRHGERAADQVLGELSELDAVVAGSSVRQAAESSGGRGSDDGAAQSHTNGVDRPESDGEYFGGESRPRREVRGQVTVRESGATSMSPAACSSSTSMQLSVSNASNSTSHRDDRSARARASRPL